MQFNLNLSWKSHLNQEFSLNYFQTLEHFLEKEFSKKIIYPAKENIFNALNATSFEKTKVIILGQDPYHQPNQAHGLSFSVGKNVKIPPSLQNIFKEIESDLNKPSILKNGDLSSWAEQGVLLLNSILTVEESRPLSHQNMGWEIFTDKIIQVLDQEKKNLVFLLWGKLALLKAKKVNTKKHLVLTAPHPSPLSSYRGFFGCKHFSKCNNYLMKNGEGPINW